MLRAADTIAKTDTGRQRRENEDAVYARPPVFVVADGMGGAQSGEVASRIAVEAFAQGLPDSGSPEERLARRAVEANQRIHEVSIAKREHAGMGTTLTAAYLDGSELAIAHVGDSRAYLLRDGTLTRLTQDHSLVDELVRRGKLTEEQAAEHPQRSIITRALGAEPTVEVDTWTYPVKAGDVLLLCSDGLTSMVSEERLQELLVANDDLETAAQALIDEANEAGGRDNITVVLFRLEEVGEDRTPPCGDGAVEPPTIVGGRAAVGCGRAAVGAGRAAVGCGPEAAGFGCGPEAAGFGDGPASAPDARAAALRQAAGRARRGRNRPVPGRQRRLPGNPQPVLHWHQLAGDRHDLPRPSVRPAVRDPPVRDLLRLRRAGRARSTGPACEHLQQQPPLRVQRLEAGAAARTGADLAVRSERNRELLGLIPASLLLTAGFAGVFIQRSNVIPNATLIYGAIFLGLCLAGHVLMRATLPHADPYLFPLAAVLASVGIVMVYRIGLRAGPASGAVVRARADPVRGDDHRVPRVPQARALPVRDHGRLAASARAPPLPRDRL